MKHPKTIVAVSVWAAAIISLVVSSLVARSSTSIFDSSKDYAIWLTLVSLAGVLALLGAWITSELMTRRSNRRSITYCGVFGLTAGLITLIAATIGAFSPGFSGIGFLVLVIVTPLLLLIGLICLLISMANRQIGSAGTS